MNNNKSNQEFKIGDTVKLKSGGPLMTIFKYDYDTKEFVCRWFVEGKTEDGYFPPDSLQLAVKKKGTAKNKGNL